jgi:murein DD-endopeptidase MepM/ murein hydrolase activator NlpD
LAKYKRSTKGGSFKPAQVSTQGEARLTEYANRIANALREERDAVISNRDRMSKAMGDASKIQSDQLERDRRIQQQNTQINIDKARQQNERAMKQYEAETAASKQIYSTIAGLSNKAALKLQEIEVERLHEQWNQDYADVMILGDDAPAVKQVKALIAESTAKQVELTAALQGSKNEGASEVELSTASERIRALSYGAKLATFNQLGEQYHTFLKDSFLDDTFEYTDEQGNKFTGKQAVRDPVKSGIVASETMQRYLTLNGLTGINPALLQASGLLDTMLGENQQVNKTAGKAYVQDIDEKADLSITYTLGTVYNPKSDKYVSAEATVYIETIWPDLVLRKGPAGALDWLTERFKTVDVNGDPVNPVDALYNANLSVDGQPKIPFGQRKQRVAEINRTLREAKDADYAAKERKNLRDAEKFYDKMYNTAVERGVLDARDAQGDADWFASTEKLIRQKFEGVVPRNLTRDAQQYAQENLEQDQAKLERLQQLRNVNGITQGAVLAINNRQLRAEAQKLLVDQNKTSKYGKNYQDRLDSLEQSAGKLADVTPIGNKGPIAQRLYIAMRRQFEINYKEGLRLNDGNTAEALRHATKKHQEQVGLANSGNPEALFLVGVGANGEATLPNLDKAEAKLYSDSQTRIGNIERAVEAKGGSWNTAITENPYLIMSKELLQNLSQTHYTGGDFVKLWTPEMESSLRRLRAKPNGRSLNMVELINASIQAHNAKFPNQPIELITSPEIEVINRQDPEVRKLFEETNRTLQSVDRGIQQANGTVNNYTRPTFTNRGVYNQTNRQSYAFSSNNPNVSSVTFDYGQPGIDVFFEDKKFPAVLHGRVKEIRQQYNPDGSGYGNMVVIESIDPETREPVDVVYAHLAETPNLTVGQEINKGDIIGTQGGTGSVQSYDGTIASIDFLAPAPAGSNSMAPYNNYEALGRRIVEELTR